MIHPVPQAQATAGPSGLIDILQAGFNVVNRHLWLLALPVAIDLLLWLGPQLAVGNLAQSWLDSALAIITPGEPLDRLLQESARVSPDVLRRSDEVARYNLLWLLAVPLLGAPSFQAGSPGNGPVLPIEAPLGAAGAAIALLILGLSVATAFYGLLAQLVRNGHPAASAFAGEFGYLWIRVVALFFLAMAAMLAAGIPFLLLLVVAAALSPLLLAVVASVLLGAALWAFVYLFFTADALFITQVGPILAIKYSVRVVRYNFWSTLGFISLIVIISGGFPIVLNELPRVLHGTGAAIAILGHIYISSGLAAASMAYYKERFARVPSSLERP